MQDNYKEDMSLDDAMVLACDVLAKSMDNAKKDASQFELGVITKDSNGNLVQRKVEGEELQSLLDKAKIGESK